MKLAFLFFCISTTSTFACPIPVDSSGEKEALLTELSFSADFSSAQKTANEIWAYWHTAPDAQSQQWLNEGVARIRQADLKKAKAILTSLVEYCPEYSEGHNQLAFAQFLAEEYDASERTLKRALELEPQHFGAIAGLGLIAHRRGKLALAKIWIKRALKVHPFLNERFILDIPEDVDEL